VYGVPHSVSGVGFEFILNAGQLEATDNRNVLLNRLLYTLKTAEVQGSLF